MGDFSVLVVDDEADFVETLLKQLKKRGVECDGAYDGREGLAHGASDYLIKPVEFDALYETLATAHKNQINVA